MEDLENLENLEDLEDREDLGGLLSIKEFAQRSYHSDRTIRQWCIDNKIEAIKMHQGARKWLIPATELDRLAERSKSRKKADLKTYLETPETPHKQRIRELAKALADKVSCPSVLDRDLWHDFPFDFKPGAYQSSIGVVQMSDDNIEFSPYDVSTGIAEPYLVRGLHSHLLTCGFTRFTELVGENRKLDEWLGAVKQYFEALMTFLKLITDEVKEFRIEVNFSDEIKPGLTKWFIITLWRDAVQKARGYTWIDDSWYKPYEKIPDAKLWQLKCGAYCIGIAMSERTLKSYEIRHKELRIKYGEHSLADEIALQNQELSSRAVEIQQRLHEFSDMQHLPGYCDLC